MMQWRKTRIGVRGRGPSELDGQVAICTDCGSQHWVLFTLGEGGPGHAQCCGCGDVYCLHPDDCEAFDSYELAEPADADTVHPFDEDRR